MVVRIIIRVKVIPHLDGALPQHYKRSCPGSLRVNHMNTSSTSASVWEEATKGYSQSLHCFLLLRKDLLASENFRDCQCAQPQLSAHTTFSKHGSKGLLGVPTLPLTYSSAAIMAFSLLPKCTNLSPSPPLIHSLLKMLFFLGCFLTGSQLKW